MISEASFNEHFGAQRPRHDRLAFFAGDQLPFEVLGAEPSRTRKLKTLVGDLVLIGGGWALLVGIVVYPQAQIVGIATCAIALLFARGGKR